MHLLCKYLPDILRAQIFLILNICIFIVIFELIFLAILLEVEFLQKSVGVDNIDVMGCASLGQSSMQ